MSEAAQYLKQHGRLPEFDEPGPRPPAGSDPDSEPLGKIANDLDELQERMNGMAQALVDNLGDGPEPSENVKPEKQATIIGLRRRLLDARNKARCLHVKLERLCQLAC